MPTVVSVNGDEREDTAGLTTSLIVEVPRSAWRQASPPLSLQGFVPTPHHDLCISMSLWPRQRWTLGPSHHGLAAKQHCRSVLGLSSRGSLV